jgi:hypothetical protein
METGRSTLGFAGRSIHGRVLVLDIFWIFKLLVAQFLRLSLGWTETAAVVRLRDWARRIGALWRRVNAKKTKKS